MSNCKTDLARLRRRCSRLEREVQELRDVLCLRRCQCGTLLREESFGRWGPVTAVTDGVFVCWKCFIPTVSKTEEPLTEDQVNSLAGWFIAHNRSYSKEEIDRELPEALAKMIDLKFKFRNGRRW